MTKDAPLYVFAEAQRRLLLRNLLIFQVVNTTVILLLRSWLNLATPLVPLYISLASAVLSTITYRMGWTNFTKTWMLLTYYTVLFVQGSSEPFETGLVLHFISVSAAAMALHGYHERWKVFGYVILATVFFLIVVFYQPQIVPFRHVEPAAAKELMLLNLVIMCLVTILCCYLMLRLYHRSEAKLIESNEVIANQNEQLRRSNAELDRFVYSVSHDLRSPLSSLMGLLNLIDQSDKDQHAEYLRLMRDRLGAMDKFIFDIISYSRNSRLDSKPEVIRLSALVEEILASLKYVPNMQSVQVSSLFEPDFDVRADRFRLRMVLNNILTNSIKYADLRKEQPWVKIEARRGNDFFQVRVSDNGIGIPLDYQDKVFDMFVRATEGQPGSGLGLYIVKEAVAKIGGKVALESVPRQGTTVTVTWPIA